MKNKGTVLFLKGVLCVLGLIVLILCISWLPGLARETEEMFPEFADLKLPVLWGIYVTVIPFMLALYHAYLLLTSIEDNKAFSEKAIRSLAQIRNYACIIIAIYFTGMIFLGVKSALHPGIALMGAAIMFAAFTIALFAAVLKELLTKALELQSENDLTV